mgnify:CR=1 FL=1
MPCLYFNRSMKCDIWLEDGGDSNPDGCDEEGYCLEFEKNLEDIECDDFENKYRYAEYSDEDICFDE